MTKKQVLWIIGLNIASYFLVKIIERLITESPKLAQTFLQYFDVNLYYAIFLTILNIGILYFILRRNKKLYSEKENHGDQKIPRLLFSDNIDNGGSWNNYGLGEVYKTSEKSRSGTYSLKKEANTDPHGGYLLIGKKIEPPFIFSGWVYRSDIANGRWADRIALEDENNNGYGFAVSHGNKLTFIEQRNNGKGQVLRDAEAEAITPQLGSWYLFMMHFGLSGKLSLSIYDSTGVCYVNVKGSDNSYNLFDRIVIHGGYPYYIDDITIMSI